IVAESLDFIATELENATRGGKPLNAAIQALLPGILAESKRVIFNGDNYATEWHNEAERRGLPNLKNTVDALPVIIRKDTIDLFTKYRVYSERELQSRYAIFCESYNKNVTVEANLTSLMARTMILPAAIRYQGQLAQAVNATKAAGVDNSAQVDLLKSLSSTISEFQKAVSQLDKALGHQHKSDLLAEAKSMRDSVLPAMANVRALGDTLETMVADDLWPLPTYREMLFIK